MKKLTGRMYIGAAAAVVLLAGSYLYLRSGNQPKYQLATVERGDVQSTIAATGNTNAVVTVQVGSQVSGNIKALYADFNSKVKKDQLVAVIDPEIFQAKVDQARANLDGARASVVNAGAQVQKAAADVSTAAANAENLKAAIAKAQVAVTDGKAKLDARLQLFKDGVTSKEERDTYQATYDAAVASMDAAKSQYTASLESVKAAEAQKQVAITQLQSAQAQVKQFQAALEQAQLDLDHTQIRAPVDGTVIARQMDVGQTVAASFQAPTIYQIAQDLTKMQVDTNVDEADIGRVRVGQDATFTVDAYPGVKFPAKVSQIRQAPINTQNVITYDVVVAVANPDLKLLPGMTANVKILSSEEDNVLKVPVAAFRFRPSDVTGVKNSSVHAAARNAKAAQDGMQTIFVMGKDSKVHPVRVKPGLSDGQFTAIDEGALKEGDQVVLGVAAGAKAKPSSSAASGGGGRRGPGF